MAVSTVAQGSRNLSLRQVATPRLLLVLFVMSTEWPGGLTKPSERVFPLLLSLGSLRSIDPASSYLPRTWEQFRNYFALDWPYGQRPLVSW